ncbi:hypothetical protein PL373_03770 [Tenacibaculum maritimum]|nr:hypothetical protein [Tenacibaculum maritimum]MDB0600272.1 hypothetical protein [Tenacibaculum maritimum]MDB0610782.1 hypothetical protein [Tenacibaculum maritimum]
MNRLIIYGLIFITSLSILIYRFLIADFPSEIIKELFVPLATAGLLSPLVALFEIILSEGKYFWNTIKCKTYLTNKEVYVSLSYLIQIKVGVNQYFLVRGNKITYQYQPVGGVYKLAGSLNVEDVWSANFKSDEGVNKDLRFFVKANKIPKIIKWFKSNKNREIGIWREFKEELLDTNILNHDIFNEINFEYIKTEDSLMLKENRFKNESYHTLIYDIFRINLSELQITEFKKLLENKNNIGDYIFATDEEIYKECFNNSKQKIGKHTKYILNN